MELLRLKLSTIKLCSIIFLFIMEATGMVIAETKEADKSLGPYKFARLYPVPRKSVKIDDRFWTPRIKASRDKGMKTVLNNLENRQPHSYVVRHFLIVAGKVDEDRSKGPKNPDEFLYKWMEAASYFSVDSGTEEIRADLDRIIRIVLDAQEEDGYINTYVQGFGRKRFSTQSWMEFYFGGHFMQAGIAHYRMTGKKILFDAAKKYIDLLYRETTPKDNWPYLTEDPGPEVWPYKFKHKERRFVQRHPDIEMALVELYRVTGDKKYLKFSRLVMEGGENYLKRTELAQHAVKETLINVGAIDYYLESGDKRFFDKVKEMWKDLVRGKVYITGGMGAKWGGEAYGDNYQLPNQRAYQETCATISGVFWHWRMLLAAGEAKYAGLMERALYNGFLAGVSLDSTKYFYRNPLSYRIPEKPKPGIPLLRRENWRCACCAPNVHRLMGSLQQYIYTANKGRVEVHLYIGSTLNHILPDEARLVLKQSTDYPWQEDIQINVSLSKPSKFELMLRVPGWCRGAKVLVNGKAVKVNEKTGQYPEINSKWPLDYIYADDSIYEEGYYLKLDRKWQDGDSIKLHLPMPVRIIRPNPEVEANKGCIAIMRGPLVYCLEEADNTGVDLDKITISKNVRFTPGFEKGLLGGITTLTGKAFEQEGLKKKTITIRAIPYYAWANRNPGKMDVWIRNAD